MEETTRKKIKHQLKGRVVSRKMDKTVVVEVSRTKEHPKYKKQILVTKRFNVHDEKNEYQNGDYVLMEETRPLSKTKHWRVVKLVSRPSVVESVENASSL